MNSLHILLIEDNPDLAANLIDFLEVKGHAVDSAGDGVTGLHLAVANDYDAVVLDLVLPGMDGITLCRKLREEAGKHTPVLMLTARDSLDDKIVGLESGADDYVVKPFDLAELLARVEGLLRRQVWSRQGGNGGAAGGQRREFGEFWIDFESFEAGTRQGVAQLSQKELEVMRLFLSRPNQVVTRRELLTEVWRLPQHPNERVVDNVIVALRQYFEEDSLRPRHILSVRGVGYRFVP